MSSTHITIDELRDLQMAGDRIFAQYKAALDWEKRRTPFYIHISSVINPPEISHNNSMRLPASIAPAVFASWKATMVAELTIIKSKLDQHKIMHNWPTPTGDK